MKWFPRFDWPYSRRNREGEPDNDIGDFDPPALAIPAHHGDNFRPTWERQNMPSPGAQVFSWETLGLMPFSPACIGTGIEISEPRRATDPGMVQRQQLRIAGIPLESGTLYSQPLYDAQTGTYSSPVTQGGANIAFKNNNAGGVLDV